MAKDKSLNLVPKLRFPEFRAASAWSTSLLEEICDVLNKQRVPITTNNRNPGPYPYYGASGVVDYVDDYIFDERLILVGEDGAKWGPFEETAFIAEGKYWVNNHAHVLRSLGLIDLLLKAYLVRSDLGSYVTGAAPPKLTLGKLKRIPVPIPSSPTEQQKIADCLGSLDDLIAATGRKLEALRQHKKGLMQQLFPLPGERVPRLRFSEFRDSSDWKSGHCRDVARVLAGYGFPDKFQGNVSGQFPFYKVSDISRTVEQGKKYISEARNYIEFDVLQEIRGKPVPTGTIIFAKIGEAIRSNRRAVTTLPAVIDNNVAGVKAIETKISDEFLFYSWSNISLIDHAGGVVPAVSKSALEGIPLFYPNDLEEQQKIADCLGSLDDLIVATDRKLKVLKQHKQGLMQQLFPSPDRQ